jgi:hypothetical protein
MLLSVTAKAFGQWPEHAALLLKMTKKRLKDGLKRLMVKERANTRSVISLLPDSKRYLKIRTS